MSLAPGRVSPLRAVPAAIERPEYVDARTDPYLGPEVKDADRSRPCASRAGSPPGVAGRSAVIEPGVTTDRLDQIGHEFLCDHGACHPNFGIRGFPKSLCTSLNEVICHGIPDSTVVSDGDIVNIDITAFIGGVPRRHQRDVPGRGRRRAVTTAGRTHLTRPRCARSARSNPAERSTWWAGSSSPTRNASATGRPRFHRSRDRHVVPFRAHRPAHDDPSASRSSETGMTFTIEPMLTLGTINTRSGTTAGRW